MKNFLTAIFAAFIALTPAVAIAIEFSDALDALPAASAIADADKIFLLQSGVDKSAAGTLFLRPGGALGTPSSGTLTNVTGLPVSTGISGLGTGIATFLATPSSANLRSALTDEVGTGAAYFVGGALGTPASGTLTNTSGLPVGGIAAISANSVVMNATGSPATPAGVAVADCPDTGGQHLNYGSGVFTCGTSSSGGGTAPDVTDGTTTATAPGIIKFNSTSFRATESPAGTVVIDPITTVRTVTGAGTAATIDSTDADKTIRFTNAGAVTQPLTAAATLGANFAVYLECDGAAGCLVDPAGSEVLDNAATTLTIGSGGKVALQTDATKWRAGYLPPVDPLNGANLYAGSVTNAKLASDAKVEYIQFALSDETTAITTGTAKITFRMPFAMTLTTVRCSLTTTSSSGTPTIDFKENGTTIFSTKITIDAGEKTSTTAAVPAVISDSALADDAEITGNIDVSGTDATGLKCLFGGTRT